jgi:putative tricarboxylic transport membrane protein
VDRSEDPEAPPPAAPPGRIRSPRDFLAGTSLVALALFALWGTADLDAGTRRSMGPAMMPRVVALAVGAVGVVLAVASVVKRGDALGRWSWRGPLFVSLAIVAFALTIRTVGLAVAGPLVVVISGAASPETRPRELVIFAAVITAFCIALFRYALSLPVPVLVLPGIVRL